MLWSTDFPFLALTLFVGAAIPGSLYTPAIYGMFGLTPLMVMLAIVRSCFQMAGAFADWVMRSLSTPVTRALVISPRIVQLRRNSPRNTRRRWRAPG
jgi:hypothetical protein